MKLPAVSAAVFLAFLSINDLYIRKQIPPKKLLIRPRLVYIIDRMSWFKHFEWKKFGSKLYEKTFETDLFGRAAQVGFYFSFAFFPLLLFLLTLFGLAAEYAESLTRELYQYLAQIMPRDAYNLVRTTMDEVIQNSSGGKLTLGAFVTLWSASAGVDSLRRALNSV